MIYSPKKMQELLEKNNFNFKKNFGQNFIVDANTINNILSYSGVDKDTLVIEIGPGAGSLTMGLSEYAGNVICYEIDTKLQGILNETVGNKDNVKIIYKDFLKANVMEEINNYQYKKIYVVANLPYYITTPIIVKLIEDNLPIDKIVVMVQKEVGDRFKAIPGTKEYNSLTIFLNYYYDIKKILDVSKNVFIPRPNVDSIVLEFNRKEENNDLKNKEIFFKLIKDSFKQKRKNLKNNLKEYDLDKIEKILKKYNLDLTVRAEALPIQIFIDIANNL